MTDDYYLLGKFQFTDFVVEWRADHDECWTRVIYQEVKRNGDAITLHDETFHDNPFSTATGGGKFAACIDDAIGRHSRSMISGFGGDLREIKEAANV